MQTNPEDDAALIRSICIENKISLATAESVTVGRVQAGIASVSESSKYFQGGVTAYNLRQKMRLLQVDRAHARKVNCVSWEVAAQMASGAARLFKATIGIATTGYAEPFSEEPEPHAYYSIWDTREGRSVCSDKLTLHDATRTATQQYFADCVLAKLAAYLKSLRRGIGVGGGRG